MAIAITWSIDRRNVCKSPYLPSGMYPSQWFCGETKTISRAAFFPHHFPCAMKGSWKLAAMMSVPWKSCQLGSNSQNQHFLLEDEIYVSFGVWHLCFTSFPTGFHSFLVVPPVPQPCQNLGSGCLLSQHRALANVTVTRWCSSAATKRATVWVVSLPFHGWGKHPLNVGVGIALVNFEGTTWWHLLTWQVRFVHESYKLTVVHWFPFVLFVMSCFFRRRFSWWIWMFLHAFQNFGQHFSFTLVVHLHFITHLITIISQVLFLFGEFGKDLLDEVRAVVKVL